MPTRRSIKTSSGITLNAIEAGDGKPLIMIPGWSQSAAEFGRNIDELARDRRG